ncbi:MAG TPA: aminopeptidase [Vicinamibacterales bacterium]|nr:aminopeptidase [Vicinamibacterales bacterium]
MNDLDRVLRTYADVVVRVGLNLREGQRLAIIGPLANGGVALDAAPLVRHIAASAYAAGAPLVEAIWGDEPMQLTRYRAAPRESFGEYSAWLPDALVRHVQAGHAMLSVSANDPDHLKDADPALISTAQQATAHAVRPFRELISRNETNWCVVAAAAPSWARRVFPDLDPERATSRLWEAIVPLCRLDQPDPVAAWRAHLDSLARRRDLLNARRYTALRYRGPGTDLTIGLPEDHVWTSGQSLSRNGILFAPNMPTEEVFTMPHRERVQGVVTASRPLSYGGTVIDGFRLEFAGGRAVRVDAAKGEAVLRQLVETDEGAARLGEVALVPHGSPVSLSGVLFYNTLFDENAASHVAFGSAYKFTLRGGEDLSDEQFERAGGNHSAVHVDFMIGSGDLEVDGVLAGGAAEPLMRAGEWVAAVSGR